MALFRSCLSRLKTATGVPAPGKVATDFIQRLPLLALILVPGFLAVLLVGISAGGAGIPMSALTRDPAEILHVPAYFGSVSNAGVLIWSVAAVVCFFAAALLARLSREREWVPFLVATGALTALLVVDDVFLFHDILIPSVLGIRQRYVILGYGVMTILYLVRFRRLIFRTEYPILATAMGFFAVSVLVDAAQTRVHLAWHHELEDGAKLLGIIAWTAYSIRLSHQLILRAIPAPVVTAPPPAKVRAEVPDTPTPPFLRRRRTDAVLTSRRG